MTVSLPLVYEPGSVHTASRARWRWSSRLRVGPAVVVLAATAIAGSMLGVVAGTQPLLAVALPIVAAVVFAGAAAPGLATLAFVGLLYSNATVVAVQLHNVPFIANTVLPALLLAPLTHEVIVRRRGLVIAPALPLIVAFLGIQTASALASRDFGIAFESIFRFGVEGVLVFVLVTNVVRTEAMLRACTWVAVGTAAVLSVLTTYQFLTGSYDTDLLGFARTYERAAVEIDGRFIPRSQGPIGEVNRWAQVLVVLVPIGVFALHSERRWIPRALVAAAMVAIFLGIATTFSRGAAIALALTLLVMVALRFVRFRVLAIVVLAVGVVTLSQPGYVERLASLEELSNAVAEDPSLGGETSFRTRANNILAALAVFADHPLLGVGPGLFPTYYGEYASAVGGLPGDLAYEAHNLFAGVAADTGLVGLVLFLAILGVTMRDLLRVRRRWRLRAPALADLAAGYFFALVAYIASGLFLHLAYQRYFWLLLALAAVVTTIAARTGPDQLAAASPRTGSTDPT